MSSKRENQTEIESYATASDQYRAAFERLKNDRPQRISKGSPVSQNNVAKEAGTDPSALRKSRFPLLIEEIQQYVREQASSLPLSARQIKLRAQSRNRNLRERLADLREQRDHLASLLSEADATILELYDRIADLERQLPASNISRLDPRGTRRL